METGAIQFSLEKIIEQHKNSVIEKIVDAAGRVRAGELNLITKSLFPEKVDRVDIKITQPLKGSWVRTCWIIYYPASLIIMLDKEDTSLPSQCANIKKYEFRGDLEFGDDFFDEIAKYLLDGTLPKKMKARAYEVL